MKIVDTEEKYKPRTAIAAVAYYDVNLGEHLLTKLELHSKEKTIILDQEECQSVLEAIQGKGWVLNRFLTGKDYQPYRVVAGSLDGSTHKSSLNAYDDEDLLEQN